VVEAAVFMPEPKNQLGQGTQRLAVVLFVFLLILEKVRIFVKATKMAHVWSYRCKQRPVVRLACMEWRFWTSWVDIELKQ